METFVVNLTRPNKSVTWGFSIQGGKDFGCPLSVLRVTPNSISDKMSIRIQDLILKINNIPTDSLTHQQAILQIQNLDVVLELGRPTKIDSDLPLPPPQIDAQIFNNSCRISTSINELPPPPPEISNVAKFNNTSHDLHYPPPPAQQINQANKIHGTKNEDFHTPSPFAGSLNTQEKLPENANKNKQQPTVGLGQFLQNQDQKRDNRDLIIQQPNNEASVPICFVCKDHIKGAYIEANRKIYCSNHFCCSFCNKPITGTQFIETKEGTLYCLEDFRNNVAPKCARCLQPIIEHQVMALNKCWHPDCFLCNHCKKPIPQGQFHIKEENDNMLVYCEKDFKDFYELKCAACKLVIDSDDKYLSVSNNNYHVECFRR